MRWIKFTLAGILLVAISLFFLFSFPARDASAQQPTGSIPTVTGTPAGPFVTVYSDQQFIRVYSGPSSYDYEPVGVLAAGEKAPALAYNTDSTWIEIVYMGVPGGKAWVYGPLVSLSPGILPRIQPPPTATPHTTPTLNPTAVAAYGLNLEPTRLPTFTPPPALKIPTFAPNTSSGSKLPFGFIIVILAFVGILGAVISFLRGNP